MLSVKNSSKPGNSYKHSRAHKLRFATFKLDQRELFALYSIGSKTKLETEIKIEVHIILLERIL